MKEIPLGRSGKVAIVDDDDYDWLIQYRWTYGGGYAHRSIKTWVGTHNRHGSTGMHRDVMGQPDGMFVDHINGNKLDNRKSNLRVCTPSENRRNIGKPRNNTSGYKGVYKKGSKWVANINSQGIYIGTFSSPEEAARAYDKKAKEVYGEYAWLNFPA